MARRLKHGPPGAGVKPSPQEGGWQQDCVHFRAMGLRVVSEKSAQELGVCTEGTQSRCGAVFSSRCHSVAWLAGWKNCRWNFLLEQLYLAITPRISGTYSCWQVRRKSTLGSAVTWKMIALINISSFWVFTFLSLNSKPQATGGTRQTKAA